MILLEDTRNPIEKHKNIHDYCKAHGIHIERTKLYVGDYTLPTDQSICVDTKNGLQEVYGNVFPPSNKKTCANPRRFIDEAIRARAAGIKLVILVEEPGIKNLSDVVFWDNPRIARWKRINSAHQEGKLPDVKINSSPPHGSAKLAAKMHEMSRLYGIEWQFCDKSETGARLCEILGV